LKIKKGRFKLMSKIGSGSVDPGPDATGGTTANPRAVAVSGSNTGNKTNGFIAGPEPISNSPVGVFGQSDNAGVFGFANTPSGTGVVGNTAFGKGTGVHGHTSTSVGVLGTCDGAGLAGRFVGDVEVTGDIRLVNADLAEEFATCTPEATEPGTVVVLDCSGNLQPSSLPYDKRVAGVVSGAGQYRPAIILGKGIGPEGRATIALMGKVYCKVDAQHGRIEVGDLLTTSPTRGYAMKADNPVQAFGSVIGKALRPIREGQGLIPILVALQ
jgi:hypothetical protein